MVFGIFWVVRDCDLSRYVIHDDHVYVWDRHERAAFLCVLVSLLRDWFWPLSIRMDSSIGKDWIPAIVLNNVKDRFLLFITHLFWIIFVSFSITILSFFILLFIYFYQDKFYSLFHIKCLFIFKIIYIYFFLICIKK